ncbi:MAG: hypothetical protein K2K63_13440 [Acetatifactor sp.]|nr:hypothetical protein [Acetatifactor sp.]
MKKRIMKLAALLFSVALLALPGTAFSFRQTVSDIFRCGIAQYTCDTPIPEDLVLWDYH